MKEARDILHNALAKWRLIRISEILLLSLALAICTYLLFLNLWVAVGFLIFIFTIGVLFIKPWKYSLSNICSHIDMTVLPMEHSTGLLLENEANLNVLSKIQQARISEKLRQHKRKIHFKNYLYPIIGFALVCIIAAWIMNITGVLQTKSGKNKIPQSDIVNFQVLDSVPKEIIVPKIKEQNISIRYPSYTNEPVRSTSNMNLKVLEGSRITWNIKFDQTLKQALLKLGADSLEMAFKNDSYSRTITADYSNFYSIKFTDSENHGYLSDLFSLETFGDEPPVIALKGLKQFSSFEFDGPQQLEFTTTLDDDFGISDAAIIATVSKGTGESVKFREERLSFDTKFSPNNKSQELKKILNLRDLKMEPGDELYFYVEALDNKQPKPNVSRTETYFSVIKDTVSDLFAVEGSLGADLMPDYFRSQRQLIIDTEKLLKEKPSIKKQEFNSRSNELGFDQKALRIKYGEFMGDETEAGSITMGVEEETGDTDPLADYTHDHDGANEHNLVDEEHEGHEDEEGDEDPLEAYVHNHENPEASTLFAQSLKSKLKQAMAEMWDAELYLRLFEPEKSLPYQYKALKLIQEIKNSARIYVHRIGFDPPPIKEDKRLTGELDEIGNFTKNEFIEQKELYPNMEEALARLEMLWITEEKITKEDRLLLDKAGNELARLAIEEPSKYLETLQAIKWLSESEYLDVARIKIAIKGLYSALPPKGILPSAQQKYNSELTNLFIEALNVE